MNRDLFEPFRHVQGQLNFGMLVPFGLLGVLATRRLGLMACFSLLLPAAIETTQALAPIGRACDTSDFVANGLGSLLGVVIGAASIKLRPGTPLASRAVRKVYIAAGATALSMAALFYALVDLTVMDHTEMTAATSAQKAAIDKRLHDAFGGEYRAGSYSVTTTGEDGVATVTAHFGVGMAELSWPDQKDFTASIMPVDGESGNAFAVPGVRTRPVDDQEAKSIAEAYAKEFAPWGAEKAKVYVSRIDDNEDLGWLVYWRRYRGAVLLPARLDVRIDAEGRISDLIERKVTDPELPTVRLTEDEAWEIFQERFRGKSAELGEKPEPTLLAQYRDGEWRVDWLLSTKTSDYALEAAVDATDGSLHDPVEIPLARYSEKP
ncbi:VanZ family protein [Streptomyces bacillaris]|uniref:VanZ family protein n=1 Tax=Streptomyces bacillaris TaxID=68179 RepID=UPI003357B4E2